MAKRCPRNGDLSDKIIPHRPLKDKTSRYLNVCMIPCHTGIIIDPKYIAKKCAREGKRPCIYYRRFREDCLATFTRDETRE